MTARLSSLLAEGGHSFTTPAGHEVVRGIKERLAYVALDYDAEQTTAHGSPDVETTFTLPDGTTIAVGSERFRCAEALFQPSMAGVEAGGIHDMLYRSIMKCDHDIRSELYTNIVLAGGSTMLPGFAERLVREVVRLAPEGTRLRVVAPPERKHMVWIGDSVLASMSSFQAMWITRADYDESGASIVHRRCV